MATTFSPSAPALLAQGIQALNAGDSAAARDLLVQLLQSDTRNLQGWLWLSGAVATPGERRYCLEQVLAIEPLHTAARRGLALLPADVVGVSPLPEPLPAWLSDDFVPPAPVPTPAAHTQAAAVASALTFGLPSRWDSPAEAEPEPAPIAPEPVLAGAEQAYHQHDVDLVLRLFGGHYSRDQIARKLSEEYGLPWDEANGLIQHVEMHHSQRIAARQSPILLGIGLVILLGGLASMIYGLPAVLRLIDTDTAGMIYSATHTRRLEMFGVGLMMVLGSLIGLGQTIRSLWK